MKHIKHILIVFAVAGHWFCITAQDFRTMINQKLQKIGLPYQVEQTVVTNENLGLIGAQKAVQGEIEDPYGTLKDCVLFSAFMSSGQNDSASFLVGVFKNSSVVWYAGLNFKGINGCSVYGTRDLNLDGKVDILVECELLEANRSQLWLFSWDGSQGRRINALTETGESVIEGNVHSYDLADIDGDCILEIRSISSEEGQSNPESTWSWNGQEYGEWPGTQTVSFNSWLPAKCCDAEVRCLVIRADSSFLYRYTVLNKRASKRRIERIGVETGASCITKSFDDWQGLNANETLPGIVWKMTGLDRRKLIQPGQEASTFEANSTQPPAIYRYFVQSERGTMNQDYNLADLWRDLESNSTSGATISAHIVSGIRGPNEFLDTLLSYIDQSHSLGWINNTRDDDAEQDENAEDGIVKNLDKRLTQTRDLIDKGKTDAARNRLEKFLDKVEKLWARQQKEEAKNRKNPKIIFTSEAYALLKYNGEYLLDHLTEPKVNKEDKKGKEK